MTRVSDNSAVVVGSGIVGLCVAYFLRQAGHDVRIVDPEEPGSQCSFGNAGAISAGSVAPLAMPGILRSAPAMLMDREGPLHIPPSYVFRAMPWLIRFVTAGTPARVEAIAAALRSLFEGAIENHEVLARELVS